MPNQDRQAGERGAVLGPLMEEFRERFQMWNKEYGHQDRDLGERGEFTSFWRKVKRIKAAVWDGADTAGWREPLRIVIFEAIAHLFLMLYDLDRKTAGATDLESVSYSWVNRPDCTMNHDTIDVYIQWRGYRSEHQHMEQTGA